jgi:hypothetical protein
MMAMFAAIAANAETLTCEVFNYSYDSGVEGTTGVTFDVDATIDGSTVTFTKFLGSKLNFDVTCYSTGSTEHTAGSGSMSGTYTLGSLGSYNSIYFYGDDDFKYIVTDAGKKTLDGVFYFNKNYDTLYDLVIYLPDNFEPKVDTSVETTLPVTLDDGTSLTVDAKIGDGTVTLLGLFGVSKITYTINELGAVSSSLSEGYVAGDYTCNGTNNSYIYFYGSTYAKYDTTTRVLSDYAYMYYSYVGITFSVELPEWFVPAKAEDVEIPEGGLNILVYDNASGSYGDTVYAPATIENGTITFENFAGSTSTVAFTCHDSGSVDVVINGSTPTGMYGTIKGNIDLGTWQFDKFLIYIAGTDYSIDYKGKYLTICGYGYVGSSYALYYLFVSLPNDFETAESAGVGNVMVDNSNAPVEYFNLQGVRVANPTSGLYIRRQGTTTAKVLVK